MHRPGRRVPDGSRRSRSDAARAVQLRQPRRSGPVHRGGPARARVPRLLRPFGTDRRPFLRVGDPAMGLIRKKGRSDKRASNGPSTSPSDPGSWKPSVTAAAAAGHDAGDDTREAAFPSELRLAVEAVAAGDDAAGGGNGSDAYGLRAELQASRRRGDGDGDGDGEAGLSEGDEPVHAADAMPLLLVSDEEAADDVEAQAELEPEVMTEPDPDVEVAPDPVVAEADLDQPVAGEFSSDRV